MDREATLHGWSREHCNGQVSMLLAGDDQRASPNDENGRCVTLWGGCCCWSGKPLPRVQYLALGQERHNRRLFMSPTEAKDESVFGRTPIVDPKWVASKNKLNGRLACSLAYPG